MRSMLEEMRVRIKACKDQPESIEFAQKQEWMNKEGGWLYATWDHSQQKQVPQPQLGTMSTQEILDDVALISKELHLTVHRFHSVRPLCEHPEADIVQFILEISLREQGHRIHSVLCKWINSLALQLVGVRLRQERQSQASTGLVQANQTSAVNPPARPEPQRTMCLQLLQCALQNPNNHCYMNHTLLPFLWTTLQSSDPDLHQLSPIFRQLLTTPTMTLMRSIMWSHLTRSWRLPDQQHDAAEFVTHLQAQVELPQFQGRWEARQLREHGIHVAYPRFGRTSECGECIRLWRQQASVHALANAAECICLQFLRFRQENGSWVKADNPTWLPRSFIMPVFIHQHTVEVEPIEYQITAITLHRGTAPSVGHYRSLLIRGKDAWMTDDAMPAKKIGPVTELLSRQIYLIWGTRVQSASAGESVRCDATPSAPDTQSCYASRMQTYSYFEVEGAERAGGTLHFATWRE